MRAFYSAGHTKKPFVVNLISMGILIFVTYGLVQVFYISDGFRYFITALLRVGDIPGAVVLMLPLGYSIGTIINGLLHWAMFEVDFRGFSRQVSRAVFESFGAAIIMGAVSYGGLVIFAPLFNTETLIGIFLQGFLAGILGILVGIAVFYALGSKELKEVWVAIHTRFWKAKVIATDPEIV